MGWMKNICLKVMWMAKIKWKSKQEIEDEKLLESLAPTKEEVENAELEIKVIMLLQDLEVI